jgi:hypothetical protein
LLMRPHQIRPWINPDSAVNNHDIEEGREKR